MLLLIKSHFNAASGQDPGTYLTWVNANSSA